MSKLINVLICIVIGLISLFFSFLFIKADFSLEIIEKLKILSYILISFSVIIAIMQFKENLKQSKNVSYWNKKQITITQLHNTRKVLKEISDYLNNFLNTRREQAYSVKEIHSLLGVIVNWNKLSDKEKEQLENFFKGHIVQDDDLPNAGGNNKNFRFIFYKNVTDNSLKNILNNIILSDKQLEEFKLDNIYYHQNWKNYDGKELYKKLHNFLSEYEYIATGVNNEIFDIKIIDELMGSGVIKAYTTFSKFIEHIREYHKFNTIYKEFESLAKVIKERREKN